MWPAVLYEVGPDWNPQPVCHGESTPGARSQAAV